MQERSIVERVVIQQGNVKALDVAPDRAAALELQLMQVREEMRGECSTVLDEMREGDEETRRYTRIPHDTLIARLAAIGDGMRFSRKG